MHANIKNYHEFLSHTRIRKCMSMADVLRASAKDTNPASALSFSQISKIEAGKVSDPRIGTAIKLARGYGVSLKELGAFFTAQEGLHSVDHATGAAIDARDR